MSPRVEIVEECVHGSAGDCNAQTHGLGRYCVGGSRRMLTEGEFLLVEKVDGEWPDWVLTGLGWTLDESHDLSAVMDGIWRERPRKAGSE